MGKLVFAITVTLILMLIILICFIRLCIKLEDHMFDDRSFLVTVYCLCMLLLLYSQTALLHNLTTVITMEFGSTKEVSNMESNINISEIAYEKYKQDWVDTHTTPQERITAYENYNKYVEEAVANSEDLKLFNEWIEEIGYPDGIYVCYDEFIDTEYFDREYIRYILDDEELIEEYEKDMNSIFK